jgi:hypothetical protein
MYVKAGWQEEHVEKFFRSDKIHCWQSLDPRQQILTLTEPLFLSDEHPVLTANIPTLSVATVVDQDCTYKRPSKLPHKLPWDVPAQTKHSGAHTTNPPHLLSISQTPTKSAQEKMSHRLQYYDEYSHG